MLENTTAIPIGGKRLELECIGKGAFKVALEKRSSDEAAN